MDNKEWKIVLDYKGWSCEHCGPLVEPTLLFVDDGTPWCDACADANGEDPAPQALWDELEKLESDR